MSYSSGIQPLKNAGTWSEYGKTYPKDPEGKTESNIPRLEPIVRF